MRRRSSIALAGTATAVTCLLLAASSTQLTAGSSAQPPAGVTLMAAGPHPVPDALIATASPRPAADVAILARQATAAAEGRGADISFELLDRTTNRLITSGDGAAFPIASVAKLFIADDLLMRAAQPKTTLSPRDRSGLDAMLRSSDDLAANDFWVRGGGSAVIARVAARYGLAGTTAPYDGNWWNTMSTTADLVRYYDMLLDGTGGLPPQQANLILSDLAASTALGADGYPQRFGIPEGLFAEPVAVKQGWMCCWNGPNWLHMSTGVIGADRRYVMAVASMQPVDDVTARNTLTAAIKTMFPGGRI